MVKCLLGINEHRRGRGWILNAEVNNITQGHFIIMANCTCFPCLATVDMPCLVSPKWHFKEF